MRRGPKVSQSFIIVTALACCVALFIASQANGVGARAKTMDLSSRFIPWFPGSGKEVNGSDVGVGTPGITLDTEQSEITKASSVANVIIAPRRTPKPSNEQGGATTKNEESVSGNSSLNARGGTKITKNEGNGSKPIIEQSKRSPAEGGAGQKTPNEKSTEAKNSSVQENPELSLQERKETLPRCETFLGYCGYFRFSNRLKEMNRMMKVAMQTHRSLIVEPYYDVKFNEIMDFDKAEELLNARAPDSPCWLRMLGYGQYIDEGRVPNITKIYCQRGNCGGKKHFNCHKNWPPNSGLEERKNVKFHNSDKLIKDNSSLIVIDGEAAFHFFQKHVPNFYSPFADDIYENTRKFMEETMEDRDGATPEMLANGGTSLGVHIRHDDQARLFNFSNQLAFIEEHVNLWNVTRMFIGTDAKKEVRAVIQKRFPYAQIRGDALCEDSETKNICVVYDQIAMSLTDLFIGSVGSTFTDRIMDMRWYHAHNTTRDDYHVFDDSTGIKYEEGGWKSVEPEHIKKAAT